MRRNSEVYRREAVKVIWKKLQQMFLLLSKKMKQTRRERYNLHQ